MNDESQEEIMGKDKNIKKETKKPKKAAATKKDTKKK